ncbi:MAG: crossover junction endodeoxyribonuclease RuvC [Sideroxyarcus sp.]|nr:crossover junction endodeoxyribonuclease RuvC [Sideroxyarcus sp.]
MTILGIDPGYGRIGYAVLQKRSAQHIDLITYGCIETSAKTPHEQRLAELGTQIRRLISAHTPDMLAMEQLFFVKNVTTAIRVGEARGVILAIAGARHIPVRECTPTAMKRAVTGYGNATKQQIQRMMEQVFHLKKAIEPDDAADAVAIAWTILGTMSFKYI